jgi:DNA-binding MarR family transcriptional regulator
MELFGESDKRSEYISLTGKDSRSKRKVHYSNIESIKKIGIVWDASNNEEFSILSKFFHKMNEKILS